jgi:multidrug transporter EmrE-like cation transporter
MPDRVISSMPSHVRPAVWAGAGIVGALAAGAVLLWTHYGSAVFFEMIMAGLAFCF